MGGVDMLAALIRGSIQNLFLVIMLMGLLAAWGVQATFSTALDALPDLSDTQVIIRTEYLGQAPQVVGDQVTYPLTTTMLSVHGARLFVFRRFLCVRHLRRQDRPLLGPLTGARILEPGHRTAAAHGQAGAWARWHRG